MLIRAKKPAGCSLLGKNFPMNGKWKDLSGKIFPLSIYALEHTIMNEQGTSGRQVRLTTLSSCAG